VKQVDTTDLKSVAERRTGSTPVFPTKETYENTRRKSKYDLKSTVRQ